MDQDIPFERIGGYKILRRLATGGTSDVLLARAEGPHGFERTVVLKLLLQQFRRDAPMEKMFAREAAAYARLSHPAIVKLYDFFSAEGQLVMVLEYIEGLPLNRFRAMLRKGGEQLDDRASIFVASRVFAALAAAHGARDPETGELAPVIHRDVNPSNILLPWDGHVKLADFGIAKVSGVSSDTQAGFIKGTYGYMAPEQVRGEPITVRTDVYAAALLLWELLARRKAIQRGALPEMEVLRAMAEPSLPSLDVLRPDLPQRLRAALARGLEPNPDARSITADEMLVVMRESVTSNEGRNVLAELLTRAKAEHDQMRSGPPPAVVEGAPAASVAASPPPPPPEPAPAPVRPTEPSVNPLKRTALGIGQVPAVTPTGGVRLAPAPATFAAPPAAPPRGHGPPPVVRPVAPASSEGGGTSAVAATDGMPPAPPERLKTAMGVAPPPPSVLGKVTLRSSSAPPPPVKPAPVVEVPVAPPTPALSGPPAIAGMLQSALAGAPDEIRVPTSVPPPPPMAMWAALLQAEEEAARRAPPMGTGTLTMAALVPAAVAAPPPQPPPVATTNPSFVAATMPRGFEPAARLQAPSGSEAKLGGGRSGTYALIAGVALFLSGSIVAALMFGRRATTVAATGAASASSASAGVAATTARATTTATPTATATATPTATATATARPTPTVTAPPPATPTPSAAAPPSTATDGTIVTPRQAGGHRIFVDGHYAGDSPGPVKVHCGSHVVKVGSGGTPRTVDVPCGGEVLVSTK